MIMRRMRKNRRNARFRKFLEALSYAVYLIRKSLGNGEEKIEIFDMINNGLYYIYVDYIVLKGLRKI